MGEGGVKGEGEGRAGRDGMAYRNENKLKEKA